jgi:peroxiredoxin family protein
VGLQEVAGSDDGITGRHRTGTEGEGGDIPPIPEFVQLIADSGAKLYACKASVDMFDLKQADFVEAVDSIITVGDFYGMAGGVGSHIIFT